MDNAPVRLTDLISHVNDQLPAGSPVECLPGAVEVSRDLGELTDRLLDHYVEQARRGGVSWSQISQGLGVSEQAARQRFAENTADLFSGELNAEELGSDRLTDRAIRVVRAAQEDAGRRLHPFADTAHLLLALIGEQEGVAAKALQRLGISLEALHQQVDEIIGTDKSAPGGRRPLTPRATLALELASASSWRLGDDYIGTDHVLLGLIWETKGVAYQLLTTLEIEEAIITAVKEARSRTDWTDRRPSGPPRPRQQRWTD
jgi:Clp amino terminal domain, pathogenicity island component